MVTVWDARAGQEALTLQGHTSWVSSAAFSPDSKLIVSAGGDKTVRVWDARTGIELLTLPGRQEPVSHVSFSPDGTLLAGAVNPPGKPGEIKVWDAHTGVALRSFVGHTSVVHSVAFSPEGSRLASASGDGMVKVWDARTGAELLTFTASQRVNSMCLAFSADGNLLASGADPDHKPGEVKVWDARTGAQLRSLSGHTGGVLSVAFNPDGRQLASAGLDKSVRVWDAHTGAQLHLLKGHTGTVHSVAFNPDGSRLASAGDDRTVRVWEPRTGIALITLGGHHQKVASVAFSPDGGRLASASEDGTVRVWYAGTDVERLPPSTADNTDTAQARRQHEDDWTTIAWHLQQIARARETSDEFALRFHLDHAFTGLREQVYACLEDDDAAGCRHASAILAAVASASDESLQQLRDVIAFPGMDSPAADELLLAWACHKRGQPAEARRWLQRAAVSMERPGLRTVMRLLGGASTGPLAALTQLSDLGNQQVKESTPRSLQSLRREIETLLGLGKP
jgi:WD40 repeat protein